MRATTTPALSARLRGAAAGAAAAALALTLVPGSAVAQETSRDAVAVRLKVADQPPVDVATVPRVWPGELLETQGVPVDGTTSSTSSATAARSAVPASACARATSCA